MPTRSGGVVGSSIPIFLLTNLERLEHFPPHVKCGNRPVRLHHFLPRHTLKVRRVLVQSVFPAADDDAVSAANGLRSDSVRRAHTALIPPQVRSPANPPISLTHETRLSKPASTAVICATRSFASSDMPMALRFAMPRVHPALSCISCTVFSTPGMPPSPGERRQRLNPLTPAPIFIPRPARAACWVIALRPSLRPPINSARSVEQCGTLCTGPVTAAAAIPLAATTASRKGNWNTTEGRRVLPGDEVTVVVVSPVIGHESVNVDGPLLSCMWPSEGRQKVSRPFRRRTCRRRTRRSTWRLQDPDRDPQRCRSAVDDFWNMGRSCNRHAFPAVAHGGGKSVEGAPPSGRGERRAGLTERPRSWCSVNERT